MTYEDYVFSEENLRKIYEVISGNTISHTSEGSGIIVRHDIDQMLDKSYRGSIIEDEYNIKSVYFALNTSLYWRDTMWELKDMQDRGHEIGWHNNAITQWLEGDDHISKYVNEPLKRLRAMGLQITGTSAHGSPLTQERGLLNYYIWSNSKNITGYPKEFKDKLNLEDYGLKYESYLTEHDHYITDSMRVFFGGWEQGCILEKLRRIIEKKQRAILLIHHQLWEI